MALMIEIGAMTTRGYGVASAHFAQRFHRFIEFCPEIKDCWPATINLLLYLSVRFKNFNCTTPELDWGSYSESYEFLNIQFEYPIGAQQQQAWIIIPSKSRAYDDAHHAEIVTKFVPNLKVPDKCKVWISNRCVELLPDARD